jgi:hypothetical protein
MGFCFILKLWLLLPKVDLSMGLSCLGAQLPACQY